MRIVFTENSGCTESNAPVGLFALATSVSSDPRGFTIMTDRSHADVNGILVALGFSGRQFLDGTMLVTSTVERDNALMGQMVGVGLVQGGLARQAPNLAIDDFIAHDGDDDDVPDDVNEVGAPAVLLTPIVPTSLLVPATKEEVLRRATSLVSPEQGSAITIYNQKLAEYTKIFDQSIALKRHLDSMLRVINTDEVVRRVNEDVEFITTKCEPIESVEFADGANLAITTKELRTEPLSIGVRIVGRMRLTIDLRYLYSHNPPNTNFVNAIKIANLDRNPREGDTEWVCGHAYSVRGEFHACYGGYYTNIHDAFVTRNLPLLVDTMIRFIRNPDPNDTWGRRIRLFPSVEVTNEA